MTIHKQYAEYHALKNEVFAKLAGVNRLSKLHMVIGVLYLVYLTASLFLPSIQSPLAVMVAQAIMFSGDEVEKTELQWTMTIFKITGFLCAGSFIIMGTYIAYHKSVVKVDAVIQVQKMAQYCMLIFFTIGIFHSVFVIFFAFKQDVYAVDDAKSDSIETQETYATVIAILIQLLFYVGEAMAFLVTYNQISSTHSTMIQFHDYLIQYRLTPRSRILRKHLPKMTMVLEEESNMDTSSIMLSQSRSRIMSVSQQHISQHTSKPRKKFVYQDAEAD
jgi:hypothetical protein